MLTHKIYYKLKPIVPRSLQFFLRRIIVKRRLKLYKDIWPIDEHAAPPPEGWPGWPDGKKFALVLTHDVESYDGLIKCRKLAELEMELGFRSSFNFVAEDYPVDKDLQNFLIKNGFEIGIHGLNHRGNIFSPPRRFLNEASRINYYLREWGAVGFRAPSMYRDFDLLHFLDILYDSSSFDTDPFEPQPQGLRTIFPVWIPSNHIIRNSQQYMSRYSNTLSFHHSNNFASRYALCAMHNAIHPTPYALYPKLTCNLQPVTCNLETLTCNDINKINKNTTYHSLNPNPYESGFVELPYTLPQDHTLFLILKEKDCRIWKEKLDWIANKGGMALILTHTDYMSFNGSGSKIHYPIDYYIKFLEYVKSTYSGLYWHKLPREVAHFYKNFILSHNL